MALFNGKISAHITSFGHGFGIATYAVIAWLSIGIIVKLNSFGFSHYCRSG